MIFKKSNDKIPHTFISTDENGEITENSARRYFSVIGFAALAVFLIRDLLLQAGGMLLIRIAPDLIKAPWFSLLFSSVALYFISIPIGALMLKKLPRATPMKSKFGALKWISGLCIVTAFTVAGNYISSVIMSSMHILHGSDATNPVASIASNTPILLQILLVAIVAPIVEELFFRKLLCDKLLPLGEKYAIFVSAAIFAIAHGNFFQLFYAFFTGCFFAYVYVNTGKIKYSVSYHIILNFFGTVVVGIIMSHLDLEALNLENMELYMSWAIDHIIPLLAMLAYEFVVLGLALAGGILLFINVKKIKFSDGLLTPPKEYRISSVFMNFGVASAILYFSLKLVFSLF